MYSSVSSGVSGAGYEAIDTLRELQIFCLCVSALMFVFPCICIVTNITNILNVLQCFITIS